MSEKLTSKVDLLGQYISLILIPRLSYADTQYRNRNFIEASIAQRSVIRTLFREDVKGKNALEGLHKKMEKIFTDSKVIGGITADAKEDERLKFLSHHLSKLYVEIDWVIWDLLHELGYFAGKNQRGSSFEDLNSIEGIEV